MYKLDGSHLHCDGKCIGYIDKVEGSPKTYLLALSEQEDEECFYGTKKEAKERLYQMYKAAVNGQ